MTNPTIEVGEVTWDDPVVVDARMRLLDLVGYLALIETHASPAELLDVNRRVHFPRISCELDEVLDSLDRSAQ